MLVICTKKEQLSRIEVPSSKDLSSIYTCYFDDEEPKSCAQWSSAQKTPLLPCMFSVFKIYGIWSRMCASKTSFLFSSSSLQFPHHFRILVLNLPTSGLTHAWRHAWRQSCRPKQRTRKLISHRMMHTFTKCLWPRKRFSIDSWIKHGFTAE